MEKGDFVRPIKNDRFKYMNREFKRWIEDNKDRRFFVSQVRGNCVRLAKVGFMITTDFLEVENHSDK